MVIPTTYSYIFQVSSKSVAGFRTVQAVILNSGGGASHVRRELLYCPKGKCHWGVCLGQMAGKDCPGANFLP